MRRSLPTCGVALPILQPEELGKHQFIAEKISPDAAQFDREIKEHAYLEREPEDAEPLARSEAGQQFVLAFLKSL